jgi:hypothetical protein
VADLITGLGGQAGFGETSLVRFDDGSSSFIDLRSIFGPQGLNYFGQNYTGLYLNNNGSVTFVNATSQYTPAAITGNTANPIIAPFWADVDTRGGVVGATPGGTSTGSDLVWYDLDTVNRTFTATWDDVGYYSYKTNKLNAFQLVIKAVGTNGDFDISFRYENVDWVTGDVSGGVNGLGGTAARIGYSSGNGVNFFELPQSGNQAGLLSIEQASNVGEPGVYTFAVRNGATASTISVGDVTVVEGNGATPTYAAVQVFLAAPSPTPITVRYATADGVAVSGQDYIAQSGILTFAPGVTQQTIFVEIVGDRVIETDETFRINLSNPVGAPIGGPTGVVTIVNDDGLAVSDVSMLEGTSATPTLFTFTVSLLSAQTSAVTVNYATESGTAISGVDFTAVSGSLTFAAGEVSKTVTVAVAADSLGEADETFNLRLSGATGSGIADAVGVGTIRNDDGLVIDDISVVEGTAATAGTVNVTIRLLSAATSTVTVNWATAPGTATSPADFTTQSGTVTFAPGQTSQTVAIPIIRDNLVEGVETFTVNLSGAVNASIIDGQATVRILDDDGFSVSDATVTEGDAGTTTLSFVVTLASASTTSATVNYATANGTAIAGSDYSATNGTLTFAAGQTSKTVSVTVTGDLTPEAIETLTLNLSNATGAAIVDGVGVGTIYDNDGVSISDVSITEGNSGVTNAAVTIRLSAASSSPVTVSYATQDGTATAGLDYTATSGTVTFAAGETVKTILVPIIGDTLYEGNETIRVLLSSPSGTAIVDGSGTITILNDDAAPAPSIRVVDAALVEGTGGGASIMRFQVALSQVRTSAVTVQYSTADGTATAGSDYAATSGTLTIPAGSLYGYIEVAVTRDATVEADETFTLNLSNPSAGVIIVDGSATGVILNDDAPPPLPTLSISALSASKAEGNSGFTPFTFTVTRTGDASAAVNVGYAVSGSGGQPANGADFGGVLPAGLVSFAAGETSKVITINVLGDTVVEQNEGFTVTLSNPVGATLVTASATGLITNDDVAPPPPPLPTLSISALSASKAEGNAGATPFTFTITRSGDASAAVNVGYSVSGGSGQPANGADFVGGALPGGLVSFAAGETSKVVTINVLGDTLVEQSEGFTVTLSNPVGATIATASATGLIANDDVTPLPVLSISALSASKAEGNAGATPFTFTITRAGDVSGAVNVTYSVAGVGAQAADGADFVGGALPGGLVSFAAGETSKVVTVNVLGDAIVEQNEGLTVTLSNPVGATIATASAIGLITNDDVGLAPTLSISALSASKAEGNAGATPFTFTITRAGDVSAAVNVTYSVAGVGAQAADGADFVGGSLPGGLVSFAAGETSKAVTINVLGDALVEQNEGFTVTLSNPVGATIATASAIGLITNDDVGPAPTLSISALSASKAEGNTGSTPFTFTVTRAGAATTAVNVSYAVTGIGGQPANAADFVGGVLPAGLIAFAIGETSKVVTINVLGDTLAELNESFAVTLSNPVGATVATAMAVGLITNDDAGAAGSLSITATSAIKAEGHMGTTPFTFTVTRSGDATSAASVSYVVTGSGGQPADAADFVGGVLPSGVVSFGALETSKVVTINVLGDTLMEADQGFTVTLANPNGAVIGTGSALGVIMNDDAPMNTITGTAGNDTLVGTSGPDQIFGQGGRDMLTGGGGADRFVYTAISQSTPGLVGRDTIVDFNRLEGDKIDLSGIDANLIMAGDQAFTVVSGDFTGGMGELSIIRWAGYSTVQIDLQGDGIADLMINVYGAIEASDFIL